MRAINRRRGLVPTAAVVCAVLLSLPGCVGYGRSDIHTDPRCAIGALDHAQRHGPVTVTIWHTFFAAPKQVLEEQVEEFNRSQDEVRVIARNQGGPDEVQQKVEQAAPEGDLPALVNLNDTSAQWAADSGLFTPAQACIDADPAVRKTYAGLIPIVRNTYTVRDRLMPVVFQSSTGVLYYNRTHFTEAGLDPDHPPGTLEELYRVAKALKKAKPATKPLAFVATSWVFEWLLSGAHQPIVNNGNGRDRVATKASIENPRSLALLRWLDKMRDEGLADIIPSAPGQADHVLAMAQQQSSMLIEGSQAATTVAGVLEGTLDAEELKQSLGVELPPGAANLKLDLDIDVGPMPGIEAPGRAQVGGSVWYLTATSSPEVQAGAWKFVQYLNRPENQALWATKAAVTPPFSAVADQPSVKRYWRTTLAGGWEAEAYRQLTEGTDPSFPGPLIGPYLETRIAIDRAQARALLGGADFRDALGDADAQVDRQLDLYRQDLGG